MELDIFLMLEEKVAPAELYRYEEVGNHYECKVSKPGSKMMTYMFIDKNPGSNIFASKLKSTTPNTNSFVEKLKGVKKPLGNLFASALKRRA